MAEFKPISDNISRLELPWKVYGIVSIPVAIFLIRRSESYTLVDAGPPEAADQLVTAVSKATEGQGIQRILLTHGHIDHIGGINSLLLAWQPEILCHKEEAPFLSGHSHYHQLKAHHLAFLLGRLLLPRIDLRTRASRTLEAGQAASGMVVIRLPGHTPGQVGYLHPTDQAMICGDALVNLGGHLSLPPALATPDPWLAKRAVRRLAELDFRYLLPSHGPPILDNGSQTVLRFYRSLPQR